MENELYLSESQIDSIKKRLTTLFYKRNFISKSQRNRFPGLLPQALKQEDIKHFQLPQEDLSDWSGKQEIVDELFAHWETERKTASTVGHNSKIRTITGFEHWYNHKKSESVPCQSLYFSFDIVKFDQDVPLSSLSLYREVITHL